MVEHSHRERAEVERARVGARHLDIELRWKEPGQVADNLLA